MKRIHFLLVISSLLLLTSCSSLIRTKVNTFRLDGIEFAKGSIKVIEQTASQPATLEYAYYSTILETALTKLGYTIAETAESADFVAFLNYSVKESDSSESESSSGRFYSYHTSPRMDLGLATGVVVIDDTRNRTIYERSLQLVIAYADENKKRVYEVRGVSRGNCGTLSAVFEEMLQAMLTGFPASNGSLISRSVPGDSSC